MENGVGVVDETLFVERNGMHGEASDSIVDKDAFPSSDDSKGSKGDDEEFQEALQGETPRLVKIDGDENEHPVLADEVDRFVEAVVAPNHDEKEDVLVTDDETSSPHKDMRNNVHVLEDNGIVREEKEKLEINHTVDSDQVNDEVIEVSKKPDNTDPGHDGSEDSLTHDTFHMVVSEQQGNVGHQPVGTRDANEVKGGNTGPDPGIEANDADMHMEEKHVEVNGTDGTVGPIYEHRELENSSTGLFPEHQDCLTAHQEGNLDNLDDKIKSEVLLDVARRDEDDGEEHEAIQVHNAIAGMQDRENHEHELERESLDEKNAEIPEHSSLEQVDEVSADVQPDNTLNSSNELSGVSVFAPEPVTKEPVTEDKSDEVNQSILLDKAECLNATASEAVAIDPENKDSNQVSGEASQPISQSKHEKECQPATSTSKSGAVSAASAQPAGLAHSALGLRERQKITENLVDRARGIADASSSSNRSTISYSSSSRPAGLGRAAPLLEPAPRAVQQPRVNGSASAVQNQFAEDPTNGEAEETDETREKLQMIRVKFLRLAHRLGQTPHNVVVAQVLYRLGLAEQLRGRNGGRAGAFSFDRASAMAEQLEAAGQEPLDFSCTIMVLGKTGVGKSATINSIFDEIKFDTDAFKLGTKKVQDVVGTVQGIKVRVIDTPGLLPSWSDQRKNEKILQSVNQYIKKTPPDIVLYLDRLDMPSRELGDMPLLRTITDIFGPSIWFNAIVVLTHAASAPPEGPSGMSTSYDMFVTQRSQVVQQAIRLAAGDARLMNPVSLVENHSACRTNRAGQRVLPNGQVWKPHLLLLSFASKILAEANTLLKLQDSPPGKSFMPRTRSPPVPFFLSSLLQSRPPVKLPLEHDDASDDELDGLLDSEDELEYDELPPFKRLTEAQLSKLPKNQRKAYYDELEFREKLFMKKQLKEEKERRKMMKKMRAENGSLPDYSENVEEESAIAASVPVVMPDLALPPSFDSDNPTYRYRYIDSSNQWLVRPLLETNGWDHDVGYEGINAELLSVVKDRIPISFSGQISKDKKDTNLQMEVASTIKHGEGKATSLGFDLQSVGKDFAYTLRSETRFSNWKKNKALAGLSMTLLGDILTGALKIEDKLIVNKQGQLVASAGAIVARGDVAYGGSLEATFRDKDPLGRFLSTLGLSVMDWHGELALGCNVQSQIPVGRSTNLIGRVNVNNRGSGQVSIRINSSEHLQIALISLVPFVRKLLCYSQPMQFG